MSEILSKAFFEGYASRQISTYDVFMCMVCAVAVAAYIYAVYKYVNQKGIRKQEFYIVRLSHCL